MLLLYIFLMSWCLPGSMGSATEEFRVKLKAVLSLTNKETFIRVPSGKFQCNLVPCQLEETIKGLKVSFKNDQSRALTTCISVLEKKVNHIISAFNTGQSQPKENSACPMTYLTRPGALKRLQVYFENLHENCTKS